MAAVRFLSQAAAGAAAVSHPGTTAAHRSYAADAIRAGGYQEEPEVPPGNPLRAVACAPAGPSPAPRYRQLS